MPVVSVCLPVCNGTPYVADAIRSVLSQTHTDLEVIVVDDASDDDTLACIATLQDERLRVLQNFTRLGIPGNWNRAVDAALGPYVCVFHQDDIMKPANLARKVAVLEANPEIQFVHSAVSVESHEPPRAFSADWLELSNEDFLTDGIDYLRRLILHGNRVCAPTVVARRSAVIDAGGFRNHLPFAPDYELWLRLCLLGRVGYLSTPLVTYRWHARNASHAFAGERGVADARLAALSALEWAGTRQALPEGLSFLREVVVVTSELRRWLAAADAHRSEGIDLLRRPR